MAVKKATKRPRARAARAGGEAAARQIKQLRATVRELRARLERETRKRRLDVRLVAEAKKARAQVARQVNALRVSGRKLAMQLQKTLTDSKSRERARAEAIAKVAELRSELGRKTEELKRRSTELSKLARESADRARAILTEESRPSSGQTPEPGTASQQEPPHA
jgi:chromosome segregation ATPase